jgi:probable rRNA maturation factor
VTDADGRPLAASGLGPWLASIAPRSAHGSVAIALAGDARVKTLNRRYRGIDRATDVLSFPDQSNGSLGDIVIATGVARRQARELKHAYRDELRTLALHGLLHLLGYDHETDHGEMRQLEEKLRARGNLRSGLIFRAKRGAGPTTRGSDSDRAGRAERARYARARSARRVSGSSAAGGGAPAAIRNAGAKPQAHYPGRNQSKRSR